MTSLTIALFVLAVDVIGRTIHARQQRRLHEQNLALCHELLEYQWLCARLTTELGLESPPSPSASSGPPREDLPANVSRRGAEAQ